MGRLIFKAPEVSHIAHRNNGKMLLVHDEGVYLMSSDHHPGDLVAYAKGCNPKTNEDYWEYSRTLVGGDDFAEAVQINPKAVKKAKTVAINVTEEKLIIDILG